MFARLKHPLGIIALVAALTGCEAATQRQHQMAVTSLPSEECRALQAVVEERERYGIVVSRGMDEDALRRCGLPHSSGSGPPFLETSLEPSFQRAQPNPLTEEIRIEKRGNSYRVPVRINQTITLPFILDTGASELAIPADVALTLIRAGALTDGDFVGKIHYSMANGTEQLGDRVVLREVQVGEHTVKNVTAFVSPPAGDPLLGQSFLSKFGTVTLDYKRLVLVLAR